MRETAIEAARDTADRTAHRKRHKQLKKPLQKGLAFCASIHSDSRCTSFRADMQFLL
jgi:hypothetical protein